MTEAVSPQSSSHCLAAVPGIARILRAGVIANSIVFFDRPGSTSWALSLLLRQIAKSQFLPMPSLPFPFLQETQLRSLFWTWGESQNLNIYQRHQLAFPFLQKLSFYHCFGIARRVSRNSQSLSMLSHSIPLSEETQLLSLFCNLGTRPPARYPAASQQLTRRTRHRWKPYCTTLDTAPECSPGVSDSPL
jgi:hypothetical protein